MVTKDYDYLLDDIKKISVEKALKIFHDSGIMVDDKELDRILDFLHLTVKITLKEFLT